MVTTIIKKKYKKNIIEKRAMCGEKLIVGPRANCICKLKECVSIGNYCEINGVIYAYKSGKITIGDYTYMNSSSFIGAKEKIAIGSHVVIASNVRIMDNNNHPTDPQKRWEMSESSSNSVKWEWDDADSKPIIIEDNVWIGEYSAVLKGVTIGKGSIVASHSVVTKDVPEYSIVAGNPARVVKKLKPRETEEG